MFVGPCTRESTMAATRNGDELWDILTTLYIVECVSVPNQDTVLSYAKVIVFC